MAEVEKRHGPLARSLTALRVRRTAPESRDLVRLEDRYGLFIGGKFVDPRSRKYFGDVTPATEEPLAEVAEASAADVDLAVVAAREAFARRLVEVGPSERGKYLFRIARIIQESSRELAVLETMDGGKPIKESRDVDLPLAAAHFFYYAGWADKLEYAFPAARRAARRRRPDHPVELPAAHGRVEDRAGARVRQHRRAQAGRDDAAHGAALRRGLPRGRTAAGRGQHRHRRGRAGAALVNHPDVDKIAFTGSTEVGKAIHARASPGPARS